MAADRIDCALERAYRGTAFAVNGLETRFVICVGLPCQPLDAPLRWHGQRGWAYAITCSPYSARLAANDSARWQAALRAYLREAGLAIYPDKGVRAKPG